MNNNRGFTLIELLMVVAMIGVLATIGIPTYQRMVQKAKRSEAKMMLAGLFTAESGFQAEYGTFGNRINRIGFAAVAGTQTYVVGFPTAGCTNAAIAPAVGLGPGPFLNTVYPAYYNIANDPGVTRVAPPLNAPTVCPAGVVAVDGSTFLATATGATMTAPTAANLGAAANLDTWTINQNRVLINTVDGVR